MTQITLSQKIILSFFILLLALVWMSRFRGGYAWSSDINVGDPYLVFNLHPVMMILGFLVFPTQAVLVFRMMPMEHFKAKVYHFVCHIFSLIAIAIGITAAIVYHYRKKSPHLYSLHSWFGCGTMGLFGIQFCFGFFAYCFPKVSFDRRKSSRPVHAFLGVACFVMAVATCSLGVIEKIIDVRTLDTTVAAMGPEVQVANWLGVSMAILMTFVLYVLIAQVGKRVAKEKASAEEIESLAASAKYDHDY